MAAKKKTQETVKAVSEEKIKEIIAPVEYDNNWKKVMAAKEIPLRRFPSMEQKYVIGMMPANKPFKIYKEVNSLYGGFYLLDNGAYIAKDNSLTIY